MDERAPEEVVEAVDAAEAADEVGEVPDACLLPVRAADDTMDTDPIVVPEPVRPADVAWAALGMAVLGASVAIGAGGGSAARIAPSLAASTIGALVLTAPAVVVAHQYLRVETPVPAVVDALSGGFASSGRLAWGLAPVGLFFAVTAPGSPSLLLAVLGGSVGLVALWQSSASLVSLAPRRAAWQLVIAAWMSFALAIGLRLVMTVLFGG